ncbi:MAG: hypothetical protein QM539_05100 [Alphaproteobacteria bacterium]|nr:hypothetical protein [Alphaproteobacteria bacterium]
MLKEKEHIYLSPLNKSYIFDAIPGSKGYVSTLFKLSKLSIFAKVGYIGSVTHTETASVGSSVASLFGASGWYYKQPLGAKFITDLTIGYLFGNTFHLEIGGSNLFDIYPDVLVASQGRFLQLDVNPSSNTYNSFIRSLSAQEAGVTNNDATSNFNQLNYSRRVSQLGINGRFLFVRLEVRF